MAMAIVDAVTVYRAFGSLVAVLAALALGRIEPAARGAYAFRILLLPGLTLRWPAVIARLLVARVRAQPPSAPVARDSPASRRG